LAPDGSLLPLVRNQLEVSGCWAKVEICSPFRPPSARRAFPPRWPRAAPSRTCRSAPASTPPLPPAPPPPSAAAARPRLGSVYEVSTKCLGSVCSCCSPSPPPQPPSPPPTARGEAAAPKEGTSRQPMRATSATRGAARTASIHRLRCSSHASPPVSQPAHRGRGGGAARALCAGSRGVGECGAERGGARPGALRVPKAWPA